MTDPAQWHNKYCGCYHWTSLPHNNYPQWCRIDNPVRHLKVPESMLDVRWKACKNSLRGPMSAKQPNGLTKAPRLRSKGPALMDDPVEDGRDLAKSDIPLPSDAPIHPAAWSSSCSDTPRCFSLEDKEVADLYRIGILCDIADAGSNCAQENIEMPDLRPCYAIRFKAAKHKRRGAMKGGDPADFEFIGTSSVSELDCTYSSEFDVVVEDDLISNAGSWVLLEGD